MVRLVNLLMRDEGEDTAIEELEEEVVKSPSETTTLPSDRVLVTADGKEVETEAEKPAPPPPAVVDSEDEDEMLIEV